MIANSCVLTVITIALLAIPSYAVEAFGNLPRSRISLPSSGREGSVVLRALQIDDAATSSYSDVRPSFLPRSDVTSRRDALRRAASAMILGAAATALSAPPAAALPPEYMKSYSSNARNLDRVSAGDMSAGSTYDNNPSNPKAARRRAMVGCKIETARTEAARGAGLDDLKEKDCNLRVMDGDTEFMLKAMRELECPTCPYGVKGG
uniref:Uncharacterized protein n=1 Tax=Pseudictyota dubia TaxID=2749911 RepID=A0A7R9W752_9STRA|mmetsp:Transcript_35407/g.65050  ORF Transcript_35407/g.65050 Transcript_35407/m.65050 type:complete len:206 (+) Transcript_35407:93-710(+)|eukprot:CAMPEP_0197457564 /NCGR_PEP_ID=MMETSP1175-20131217/46426_1 /TAXON_ID=1003142 /ORGANISM="Triceratium dubium, Strain CCMP147" /LENGTH=205 /DNA_ID=CAMNT_0042991965 /DNA_START=80 /DNA_END=697 /DNA_ORIENTATION=+